MKKLNLPVIKDDLPEARDLTLEEHLQFVLMNMQLFPKQLQEARRAKKNEAVNVRFKLK